MATSGSQDWSLDASDVIEEAYERCGLEFRSGYDARTARRSMNLLFADWANRGIKLWKMTKVELTLTDGTANYTLGTDTVDVTDAAIQRDSTDYLIERISRNRYHSLPKKSTEGRPTQYYVDRQRAAPVVYLYPTPENSTDKLVYYKMERIEDIDASSNDPDIPYHFYPALVSGLSYYLSVKKAPDRTQMLKALYDEDMYRAEQTDRDDTNMRIVPRVARI